ncbi:putative protein-L-isoaspartate(D-aspartate) O-methyltransferase [Helianthus debilis subsp. tardiflorus]
MLQRSHNAWRVKLLAYMIYQNFCRNGYLKACFALMFGPQGRTIGVEHIPDFFCNVS